MDGTQNWANIFSESPYRIVREFLERFGTGKDKWTDNVTSE
jgi:hypothetical protein